LYDLKNDPGEFDNLWDNENYKTLKTELITRHLDTLMRTVPPGIERIAPA